MERDRLAATIDRDLEQACRAEAGARLALGEVAGELLHGQRYRRLGFPRLSDYARERLGLSGRTVEDAARVARRLRELPMVAEAFRTGLLSWTKLRALVDIARGNERAWLDYALTHPSADLVAATRAHGTAASSEAEDLIDGEPPALLRIACPARLRSLWRRACEMASRVAGRPLVDWQAAELVAAEAIAGRPPGVSVGDRVLAALVRLARRQRHPTTDRRRGKQPDEPPAVVEVSGAGIDDVGPVPRSDPVDVDRRLREAVRTLREAEPRIGRLLRLVVDHHVYRAFWCRSLDQYACDRLGISVRKAWALIRVERGIRRTAPFADAYERGGLSWVRALTLLPVVDRFNAEAWLARANAVTVRRLADEVDWVLDRRDLEGPDAPMEPPPVDCRLASSFAAPSPGVQIGAGRDAAGGVTKNGTPASEVADAELRFLGPATVVALFRDALDLFAGDGEPRWRTVERMLRRVLTDWEGEPRHRDPVFARDGWRCTVPACSGRRNLHDHHVRFRSRGGDHERANRTTVCAAHHLHGIHAGIIRASGEAPLLRWDLPLFSCIGDRYV
jgi:hypothetical protein